MSLHRLGATVAFMVVVAISAARADPSAPPPAPVKPADVSIADTLRIPFISKVNGHHYSIDIALPQAPPPPGGYPVIYVLDGDAYFPSVVGATRLNGNAPQAVVVGIGYPHDPAWADIVAARIKAKAPGMINGSNFIAAVSVTRAYDMTLPATQAQLKESSPFATPADAGGLDDYLKTIETEVKPRVRVAADAYQLKLNPEDQTLFGHSLGGLAVLEALFTEPKAFRTFVAASPSIWWADRAVLQKEAAFDAAVSSGAVAPRVLITVGADEETPPKLPPALAGRQAALDAAIKADAMVGNACALAGRLRALHGARGYVVENCAVFPEQSHGISVWPAIGRAVSFAFPH